MNRLKNQLKEKDRELEQARLQLQKTSDKLAVNIKECEKLKSDVLTQSDLLSDKDTQISSLQEENKILQSKVEDLEERITELSDRSEKRDFEMKEERKEFNQIYGN